MASIICWDDGLEAAVIKSDLLAAMDWKRLWASLEEAADIDIIMEDDEVDVLR